jgi:2',3'-cyclic-nucleotide 2'-phosphodiesterase (5'-nucleotidase family)
MKKSRVMLSFLAAMVLSLAMTVTVFAQGTTVTILHTNDIHGRFIFTPPGGAQIGIDTIASIRDSIENVVLVDAGDTFHGLPFVNLNRGLDAVELMNLAGFDFFTPGNHDFNFGQDRLLELEEAAEFGFISANIFNDEMELLFDATFIIEIDGVRLGFFGLSHPDTPTLTNPVNVEGLYFADPVEAARIAVEALQEAEVDVIIALAHLGSGARSEYRVDGWGITVAEGVPGIDLLIDGHSHSLHDGGLQIGDALLVQAGDHLRQLGRVDITVYEGEILSMVSTYITRDYAHENFEANPEIYALIEEIRERQEEELSVVIAYLEEQLYVEYIRVEEMPIGNLVADALRWGTGADIALANGGGIRDILPAGEVTIGHVYTVLPFGNNGVTLEITPALLREILEHGIHQMPASNGRFPQVSGMTFIYNVLAPEGNRILEITVAGQPLDLDDDETTLIIATNNFLAAGGDGYAIFAELEIIGEFGTLDELLIAYLQYADLSGLAVEGRIVEVTEPLVEAEYADEDDEEDVEDEDDAEEDVEAEEAA